MRHLRRWRGPLALLYLIALVAGALWPFRFEARCVGQRIDWLDGANGIRLGDCGAVVSPRAPSELCQTFRNAGGLTLEARFETASTNETGPARIVSYAADPYARNVTLAQEEDALVFRLRTVETDPNGIHPHLEVPGLLRPGVPLHVTITYDGRRQRVYLGDELLLEFDEVHGGFENWDCRHRLAIGNEVTMDRPWHGEVYLAALYSRALGPEEVAANARSAREARPGLRVRSGLELLYDFRDPGSDRVRDQSPSGRGGALEVDPLGTVRPEVRDALEQRFGVFDLTVHAAACAPFAWIVYVLLGDVVDRSAGRRWLVYLLPAVCALGFGIGIELAQLFFAGRHSNPWDPAYGALGAAAGSCLLCLALRRRGLA